VQCTSGFLVAIEKSDLRAAVLTKLCTRGSQEQWVLWVEIKQSAPNRYFATSFQIFFGQNHNL